MEGANTKESENKKKEPKFKILNARDRIRIDLMVRHGHRVVEIAEEIGCHRSTIYNELKRARYKHTNYDLTEDDRYNPDQAQKLHEFNQTNKGPGLKIDKDQKLADFIEKKIVEEKYSPEAVLLHIKNSDLSFAVEIQSVNTIYGYIDKGIFRQLERKHLPCGEKKRERKRIVRIPRKPKTDTIDTRPKEIDGRETFGHWEMDTVVGGQGTKKSELVLSERKTRFEIIEPLKHHTMDEVRKALNRIEKDFGKLFYTVFKTITVDNGSEFQDWESIEKALNRVGKRTKLYYCHAYSAYERGTNENSNKLIRRYVPKGGSFDDMTRADIKKIEAWMNDYPRGIFGGKTSHQMYEEELAKLDSG